METWVIILLCILFWPTILTALAVGLSNIIVIIGLILAVPLGLFNKFMKWTNK